MGGGEVASCGKAGVLYGTQNERVFIMCMIAGHSANHLPLGVGMVRKIIF